MLNKLLALLMSVLLILNNFAWAASSPVEGAQNARATFDKYFELITELRSHIDRSQFDLVALLDSLDYDAGEIIAFVQDEIQYEPYAGVLRGARGTLMSRAGNSIDQSLLLATLLNDAGLDARIVRGKLSPDAAASLLLGVLQPRKGGSPIGDLNGIKRTIDKMNELIGSSGFQLPLSEEQAKPQEMLLASLRARAEEQTRIILDTLKRDGVVLGGESTESLMEEARDYFWVEYRDGPSASWSAVHPSWINPPPHGLDFQAKDVFVGSLPRGLMHHVRVQAFIKRRLGNNEEIVQVMEPWERPSANLIGVPLSYSNFPIALPTAPDWTDEEFRKSHSDPYAAAYHQALEKSTILAPMFNGDSAPGAQYFDLAGNLIPPAVADSVMAGLFQELGSKTDRAASALSALGEPSNSERQDSRMRALLEQFLQITLIKPNGDEEVIKRILIENPSGEASDILGIGQQVTLSVANGTVPQAFVIDSILEQLERSRSEMSTLLGDGQAEADAAVLSSTPLPGSSHPQILENSFFSMSEWANKFVDNAYAFHSEPTILATYRHVWLLDAAYSGFDIVNNSRRAISLSQEKVSFSPESAVLFGVWESLCETLFNVDSKTSGFSTFQTFESISITPSAGMFGVLNPEKLGPQRENVIVSEAMEADLAKGFSLVFLTEDSHSSAPVAWWRVNPKTGETLGMIETGWGGFLEYVKKLTSATFYVAPAKALRAFTACQIAWSALLIANAFGTGNILGGAYDPFPEIVADVMAAIGYGLGVAVQIAGMWTKAGAHKAFLRACIAVVIRVPVL